MQTTLQNLSFSLNATIPIFLMMVFGGLMKKVGLLDDHTTAKLNQFVFKALLPVLLFMDLSKADFQTVWDGKFVLFCFLPHCLVSALPFSCPCREKTGQNGARSFRHLTAAVPPFWESPLSTTSTDTPPWPP